MVTKSATAKTAKKPAGKYIFSVGRRKSAIARVKFYPKGSGELSVNGKEFEKYFSNFVLQQQATLPLSVMGITKKVDVTAKLSGGGSAAQAEAMSLAIARALVESDEANKTVLKKQHLLTRDSRKKERKKPGLKRARRAPQFSKR